MIIEPLTEGYYYHIYNRGINSENIFRSEENYRYFLQQYQFYLNDVLDTYCYCLLKNHFHLLVFTKENIEVKRHDGKGLIKLNASKQFSHFFNSYAQAFNKMYKRTGGLFESPFHRIQIKDETHFSRLVYYIHTNANKHGFADDFKNWKFSSYHQLLSNDTTFLKRDEVLNWFNGKGKFEKFHLATQILDKADDWQLE